MLIQINKFVSYYRKNLYIYMFSELILLLKVEKKGGGALKGTISLKIIL